MDSPLTTLNTSSQSRQETETAKKCYKGEALEDLFIDLLEKMGERLLLASIYHWCPIRQCSQENEAIRIAPSTVKTALGT